MSEKTLKCNNIRLNKKECHNYTCIVCITIDSVMRMEKKFICKFI